MRGVLCICILKSPLHRSNKEAAERTHVLSGFSRLKLEKMIFSRLNLWAITAVSVLQEYVGCGGRKDVASFWETRTDEVFAFFFHMRLLDDTRDAIGNQHWACINTTKIVRFYSAQGPNAHRGWNGLDLLPSQGVL